MSVQILGVEVGGSGEMPTFDSLDDALAAARAGGAEGELYKDSSTGALYAYQEAGKGWLWTPRIHAMLLGLLSNIFGLANFSSADDLPACLARGFVQAKTGAGDVTKEAGGPLVVSAPNPATSTAELEFVPDAPATRLAVLFRLDGVTGTNMAGTRVRVLTNSRQFRLTLTNGSAGNAALLQSFNAVEADAKGALSVAAPVWVLMVIDGDDPENLCTVQTLSGNAEIAVEYGEALSGTYNGNVEIQVQNTTNQPSEIQISEFAVGVLG